MEENVLVELERGVVVPLDDGEFFSRPVLAVDDGSPGGLLRVARELADELTAANVAVVVG